MVLSFPSLIEIISVLPMLLVSKERIFVNPPYAAEEIVPITSSSPLVDCLSSL